MANRGCINAGRETRRVWGVGMCDKEGMFIFIILEQLRILKGADESKRRL